MKFRDFIKYGEEEEEDEEEDSDEVGGGKPRVERSDQLVPFWGLIREES